MSSRFLGIKLLYGFLLWLLVFAGAYGAFLISQGDPYFMKTMIDVVFTLCTIFFTVLFFQRVHEQYLSEGISVGVIWMVMSWLLDQPIFVFGPWARPFPKYALQIGLDYFVIPITTIGIGFLLEKKWKTAGKET